MFTSITGVSLLLWIMWVFSQRVPWVQFKDKLWLSEQHGSCNDAWLLWAALWSWVGAATRSRTSVCREHSRFPRSSCVTGALGTEPARRPALWFMHHLYTFCCSSCSAHSVWFSKSKADVAKSFISGKHAATYAIYSVYFLYCALLNHKRQEQQPTAATMPSKPVVTGKCRASKPPCPVLAVVGFCGCSFVWCASEEAWQRPHWAASSSYAYPRYSEDRKRRRTPDAAAPTAQPTHWCHTIRPPLEHLATSTRTSHTAHPLELQHRRLFADRALSKRTIKTRKH